MSGLYLLGIPMMLLANIVLARTLSVAEFGTFGFAIALATVLAIPVAGGLPMLLTREVAAYSQNKDWAAYRGLVVAAYGWVAAMCGLIALGLSGWWLVARDLPAGPLLVTVLLVPFLGLNGVRAGILKGLGRPVMAEAPPQLLQPALMILGYLGLAWLGLSYLPMVILIVAQIVSVVLGNGGMLLAMGGYERQTLYSLVLSLAVIATLSVLLIEPYGAVGAAVAAGAGFVAAKLYVYLAVRRHYAISSGIF